jgi:DNA-binding response OmpR family regulator
MARILIVDDNEDNRLTMAKLLELGGHEVAVAADGEKALSLQKAAPFDLLITDIFMPDKDGVETIREFHQKYPATRIIAMSGGGSFTVDYLTLSLEIGADKVLKKPFDADALESAVRELLRKQSAA